MGEQEQQKCGPRTGPAVIVLGIVLLWLLAIALAATLDRAAAAQAHEWGTDLFLRSHKYLRESLKAPGYYLVTICIAIPVVVFHARRWRAGAFLLIGTATAGSNEIIKWMSGRARPFKTLTGNAIDSLTPFDFHPFPPLSAKNLCFPSGHATLAFATAAALSILFPRCKWVFYLAALIVAAERVLETAHWMSDVVAGAAVGIGGVWILRRILWDNKWGSINHDRPTDALFIAGDSSV